MRALALAFLLALTACAADAADPALDAATAAQDDEAETAAPAPDKADAATRWLGVYATHASTHQDGDITNLDLASDGFYVRARCYHAHCALRLPETDRFDVYTSSTGKTYVRFWSFTVARDGNGDLQSTPTIVDVYELVKTSSTIKLRKSYTTRWFSLYRASATCSCAANQVCAPGAGGCIATPGADESRCDGSDGLWTDDDATRIGSYCMCGLGRYDDATGACAAI